jgi:hypothetical protein
MSSKYILFWAKLYSVRPRLYVFIYVGRAGHFWGATAYPGILCQLGSHHSPQTHGFPWPWFQKGRQEAKSKFHNPTREQSHGGLEFLMKLKVEQNVCLCQQAGTFWRLIWDGCGEWEEEEALCFWPPLSHRWDTNNLGTKTNSQGFL